MFADGGLARTKPRRRRLGVVVILAVAALAATVAYAIFFEPQRIEITRHSFVGNVKRPLAIAHLTDLHMTGMGSRERNLIQLLRKESPDIIVITGDTTDSASLGPARDFLLNVSAPLGVWLVRGDSERWSIAEKQRSLYAAIGVNFLQNQGAAARDDVWLAGLDDPSSGTPDMDLALEGAPAPAFKLVLMHSPDYFTHIAGRFDLALAGHGHGGQIVLPGYGPLMLPAGARRYVRGWFTQNRSHLFVNRGLGTSTVPARLFARPELAIIEVRPP
jgi:predicted MPP superfamily phosphohydrolase